MTIAYAAYTEGCTFLLDEAGVCRRALIKRTHPGEQLQGGRTPAEAARLCMGAQYVASIDPGEPGGLVARPRAGAALLFAYVGEGGRIGVVRTGPLLRFESLAHDDDSGVRERPEEEPSETTLRVLPTSDDTLRDDTLPGADDDDGQLTVPLRLSGERQSCGARASRSAPPVPRSSPPPPPARPPWDPSPRAHHVALQRVTVVSPSESAPTLDDVTPPPGRGMLPRGRRRA